MEYLSFFKSNERLANFPSLCQNAVVLLKA